MVNVISASTSGARNIHVLIEFLLIILTDVPKDFIHHDQFFDLLACAGALTREVSTLVCDFEEKSRNEESTNETSHATLDLLKDIELLKEDLKNDHLKAPDSSQCCFPMSDGPLFIHLLLIHLNGLLDSNSYSIALIKEEIGLVKEDLELLRSFFVSIEQEWYKDLWARVLDVANEAKDVIDSIIVRDNGLLIDLKPRLIHLACFQKDKAVRIHELKDYWRAEGLVEEVMEVYLDNLISSSLLIHFNEIGRYPTCQLHDLVHDFCFKKAREGLFFDSIRSSAPSSSSDLMPRIVNIHYNSKFFGLNNFVLFGSNKQRHSGKHLYSLAITGHKLDESLSDICHLRHLRLLRVLQLKTSFIKVNDSLLNEICTLNHLRFLRIGTEVKSLPSSFSTLWNLETLWVENEESTLVLLPRIWDLVKLRVLLTNACSFFDIDTDEPILIAEDTKLKNLRVLQRLVLSHSKDTEHIFKRFPNLQQLYCVLKEPWDYSTERYCFPKLDFLTELELLNVKFESSNSNDSGPSVATNWSWDFHFPSNLKKLQLCEFPMTSDSLSTIARLPNLEELFLMKTNIRGEEWNMGEEDAFEKLKLLHLYEVTLAKWDVGEESFPVLEKLVLWGCRKLEEIPPSFGDIYSLKIIKLVESPQLEDSAKNIKQYVEDMTGEDKLQILGLNNIPLFK